MLEVLDAVGLEEHQQDEGPQAQDEAAWWVPVSEPGLLWEEETGQARCGLPALIHTHTHTHTLTWKHTHTAFTHTEAEAEW